MKTELELLKTRLTQGASGQQQYLHIAEAGIGSADEEEVATSRKLWLKNSTIKFKLRLLYYSGTFIYIVVLIWTW